MSADSRSTLPSRLLCGLAFAFLGSCFCLPSVADEGETASTPDTWAIDAAWIDDNSIVAATTAGLHYQPSQLVVASAENLDKLTVVGTGESSLWTALPVGEQILATDYKGGIHLFDAVAENKVAQTIDAETRWIRASASAGNQKAILGTQDGKLLLVDTSEGKVAKTVDAHGSAIFDITVSPDGKQFATATETGQVGLFSVGDMKEIAKWSASEQSVWAVAFSGDKIITAGADRHIKVWEPENQTLVVAITSTSNWGSSLIALPKSDLVICGALDGTLTVVDSSTLHSVSNDAAVESGIWSLALSPSGTQLLVATRKHGLKILGVAELVSHAEAAQAKAVAHEPPAPE